MSAAMSPCGHVRNPLRRRTSARPAARTSARPAARPHHHRASEVGHRQRPAAGRRRRRGAGRGRPAGRDPRAPPPGPASPSTTTSPRSAATPTATSSSTTSPCRGATPRSRRGPDGQYVLSDVGSLNGTYLNRERIEEAALRERRRAPGRQVQAGLRDRHARGARVSSGPDTEAHLSIGEVLALLQEEFPDVTISKIRFLESQGLIDPERTAVGLPQVLRRRHRAPAVDPAPAAGPLPAAEGHPQDAGRGRRPVRSGRRGATHAVDADRGRRSGRGPCGRRR